MAGEAKGESPLSASELRALCRGGIFTRPTSGYAYGNVQANLMIVPRESALVFTILSAQPEAVSVD